MSLTNLSLSCYPEKINYVNQVLTYAKDKVIEYSDTPDLHSKVTESNLLALLLAPITNYPTVLTLLLLDSYQPLLALQTYSTRKAVAHAIISSVLRNETIISEPEDVNGVLEMCDVLIRDQKDAPVITAAQSPAYGNLRNRKTEFASPEQEELAEEQGWLARMVHLLRSDDEDKQFLVNNDGHLVHTTYSLLMLILHYLFSFFLLLESNCLKVESASDIPSLL